MSRSARCWGAAVWAKRALCALLSVFFASVAWAVPPRLLLPPGEDPAVWAEALMIAGLEAGPPLAAAPGVLVLRVAGGWQLEALDGAGGRRTLVVAPPVSDADRQELAILARSLTRPVQVAAVEPPKPKPTPRPAVVAPAPPAPLPPPPAAAIVAVVPPPPPVESAPNGLRLSILSGVRAGGTGPAAELRAGLLVGSGRFGVGPSVHGSLPGAVGGAAADQRSASILGGALGFGLRGRGRSPQVLVGLGAERRNFRLNGDPLLQVWVPRLELSGAGGWGPRPDRLLVTEAWAGADLRQVLVQIGDGAPEPLGRFSAGVALGVRLDGRRR